MSFSTEARNCKSFLSGRIKVHIKGDRALFSCPEMTVERQTYDVPTISAVQGILRAVYNHDGMDYDIKDIFVCRKIRYNTMVRNETKIVQSLTSPKPYLVVNEENTLRSSTFLVNVEYVVSADIIKVPCMVTPKEHRLEDFYNMFDRRLNSGGLRHEPCLGQQEFNCFVRPFTNSCIKSVYAGKTINFGIMYQKKMVNEQGRAIPIYAETKLVDGRLEYGKWFTPVGGFLK